MPLTKSKMTVPPRRLADIAPLAVLLAATIAALWPVCRAQFVEWDDQAILFHNPTLNPPALANLRIWWTTPHQRLYTPVAYTIWGILTWLARVPPDPKTDINLNPRVFHVANLILHMLTATVVYFLLRRLLGQRWPATAGAILFAVHPVQVESVAHASGIQGLLCGLFGLTAVLLYLAATCGEAGGGQAGSVASRQIKPTAPRLEQVLGLPGITLAASPPPARYVFLSTPYIFATVSLVLALLSKPPAMTLPVLAAILQVVYLRRRPAEAIRSLWPWFVLALPCAIIVRVIQKSPRFDVPIPFYDRPLIACYTIAFYVWKLVWPWRLGLVYPRASPAALISGDAIYYTWLVPAGLATLLWDRRRHWRPLIAAAIWFVAALFPVLGLTRFDFQSFSTVADRYLYLPMFGIALGAGWALSRPWSLARPKRMTLACAILLCSLGARSWAQTLVWHDTDSLFRNAHEVNHAGRLTSRNDNGCGICGGQLRARPPGLRGMLSVF